MNGHSLRTLPPLVVGVIGLGLFLRLAIAWTDLVALIQTTIIDDAFYYFEITKHATRGQGVSFDSLHPTNGFHPLWLVLLIPIFYLTPPGAEPLPIHLALTLGALIYTSTALALVGAARRLGIGRDPLILALTVAAYALNPRVFLESVNGMETSLATFLFALTTWMFFHLIQDGGGAGGYVALGLLSGLLALARTDYLIFLFLYAGALGLAEKGRRRLVAPVLIVGASFLPLAPWLLWNLARFGSVIQTSGVAVPWVVHANFIFQHGPSFFRRLRQTLELLHTTAFDILLAATGFRKLFLLLGFALGLLWYPGGTATKGYYVRGLWLLAAPAAAIGILTTAHALRWYPRMWYFIPAAGLAALFLGLTAQFVAGEGGRRARSAIVAFGVLMLAIYGAQGAYHWGKGLYPWQVEMYQAGRWLAQHTPPQARIAGVCAILS